MTFENIEFIAIDLDGTLLDDKKNISKNSIEALQNTINKGIIISYASGRSLKSMHNVLKQFRPNGPIITYNGVKIYDQKYNIISHQLFSKNDSIEVIKYSLFNNLTMIIWSNELIYCSKINDNIVKYASISGLKPIILGFELTNYNEVINQGIDKILIYEEHDLLLDVQKDLHFLENTHIEFSSPYYLEFYHKNASKGKGVVKVCETLNIPLEKTMAFGDQPNDASMLEVVKFPIIMGNSTDELKTRFKNETLTNNNDGVAYILNKIVV